MKDEIKEILESLDKIAKGGYYPEDLLYYENCKILLDYITNLQEENERLNLELSGYRKAILNDDKLLGLQDYKSRNEKEKGQTLPLGYLKNCSYNQMCDLAGDGWTVDIIAHIFSYLESKGE